MEENKDIKEEKNFNKEENSKEEINNNKEPTVESVESAEKNKPEGKNKWKQEIKKAKEEAEKAKAEAEDMKRKWYSVSAEYENYRRRTQAESAKKYTDGRSDVIASLFPIGDNLERALAACSDEKTKQGIEMVLKAYKKVLESEKVEEIDPTGQAFNADFSEAIMAVEPLEGEESGMVKQVYVKGYKRGDKVLRYAQVIVTK